MRERMKEKDDVEGDSSNTSRPRGILLWGFGMPPCGNIVELKGAGRVRGEGAIARTQGL